MIKKGENSVFLALLFKNRIFTYSIFFWALLVSYSRIYSGVHYPGDIICGALLGISIGLLVNQIRKMADQCLFIKK
jgi:undecaprenyl-diphosphatase